ncbi:MAG: LytR C-terminal domain-containing protein [Elusimicrobia bacterium]|nr:LytR C-terminal domain-containing protein [Elusimicrobiota bacterium]
MEFPRAALNAQRVLAVFLLVASLGAAYVERTSPLSAHIRAGRPWPFWLAVREPGRAAPPALHFGVYDPVRRSLVLIHIPETTRLQGKLTAARAYTDALRATDDESSAARAVEDLAQAKITSLSLEPVDWPAAGRLTLELAAGEEADDEPAAAAAAALKGRGRSLRALAALVRAAPRGRATADALLLTLELRRVTLERLEPALLPDDASAPAFLARALSPRPAALIADERPVVVEVLNGTDMQGLAAQASKVLVSRGVDVISKGPSPRSRLRTVVYDRIGDFERAARVRAALGCPTAIATTRIDPLRGVDASVELGDDCSY